MLNNNKLFQLTFLLFLLFAGNSVFAGKQEITMVKAMQLFDQREFETAETAFKQLLEKNPDNTMLNYYYGASRTENGHFSEQTLNYLLAAGKDVTPHQVNYYIAVQHHAQNNFDQALKFYNRFRHDVPEEEQQDVQLRQKIQQCFDRINPFTNADTIQSSQQTQVSGKIQDEHASVARAAAEEQPETDTVPAEGTLQLTPKNEPGNDFSDIISTPRKVLPDLPGVKTTYTLPEGDPIDFQINNDITYLNTAHFQTQKGKKLFLKGKTVQEKVKQNLEKADELRDEYRNTDDAEKKAETGEQILTLENESYELREEATQLFSESRESENRYWQQAGRVAVHNFLVELDKMQRVLYPETAREETKTVENDTSLMIAAYDLFNIPGIENPRTQEKDQENELIYKIQIGAYSRGLPAYVERLYKKLSFIRKIENYTDEDGVVVYTTGNLKNLEDAIKMQNQVKQEGVEDAFVVPYFKGKRITLEEAKKLEAEK